MDILQIIRQKAFRRIASIKLINGKPLQISVTFEDNSVAVYKDTVALRMWAVSIQNLDYTPIQGNTDHCIQTPLGFYKLLGFRPGEAVLFRDAKEVEEPILFSSP